MENGDGVIDGVNFSFLTRGDVSEKRMFVDGVKRGLPLSFEGLWIGFVFDPVDGLELQPLSESMSGEEEEGSIIDKSSVLGGGIDGIIGSSS